MTKEINSFPLLRMLSFVLILSILSLVFLGYFHEITAINQDLGRHLLTGELIWENKSVPTTNLYSYTYPDFPFINHHYLSEVIFYLIYQAWGFGGLLFFTTSLMVAGVGLLLIFARKYATSLAIGFVSLLYLPILFERTDLRPEILSYFFFILFIVILFRYKERFTRWIYLLPFIELLWVNSHIYFPLGIVLLGLFLIDNIITSRKNLKNKQTLTLFSVALLSGVITSINPNGLAGALYPLSVFQNYGYSIEENQTLFFLESLGFHKASFLPLKISVFLLFLSLLLSIKKARPIDWLLSVTFTIVALLAVRNFPLFVFATLLPFTRSLSILYKTLIQLISKKQVLASIFPFFLSIILVILLIWQGITLATKRPLGAVLPQGASKAITFFEKNKLNGPLFNNFDIGSYLSYELYPQEKVFIDGRPEAYPASFIQDIYIPMQEDANVFAKTAEKYKFNTIIFSHTDQTPWAMTFLKTILTNPDWKTIYLDPMIIILVKNTPTNQNLIEKYAMTPEQLEMQHLINDLPNLYQAVSFFKTVGLIEQEKRLYQEILIIDPQNCPTLYNLAISENQQNMLTLQRYNLYCQ